MGNRVEEEKRGYGLNDAQLAAWICRERHENYFLGWEFALFAFVSIWLTARIGQ